MRKALTIILLLLFAATVTAGPCPAAEGSAWDLLKKYKSIQEPAERISMVRSLGADQNNKQIPVFLQAAFQTEEDKGVKIAIVQTLILLNTEDARSALVEVGCSDEKDIQTEIYSYLKDLGKGLPLTNFAKLALSKKKDKYAPVKVTVLRALALGVHKDLLNLITRQLKDDSEDVRVAAVKALDFSADERSLKKLEKVFKSDTKKVQLAVIRVFENFENKEELESSIEDALASEFPEVKEAALTRLCMKHLYKKIIKEIAELIVDENPSVRKAAITVLQAYGERSAVGYAVKMLKNAGEAEAVRIKIALEKMTAREFATYDEWNEWWKKEKGSFEVKPPEDKRVVTGSSKAKYYGSEVTAKKIIFIIDASKSMSQTYQRPPGVDDGGDVGGTTADEDEMERTGDNRRKIDYARRELVKCIRALDKDVKFNIIAYKTFVTPWLNKLVEATRQNKKLAEEFTRDKRWEPKGLTNIYDALRIALQDKEVTCIYLLSDGEPTAGEFKTAPEILQRVKEMNKRKVEINTIGFGLKGWGEQLMKDLAAQNNGEFIKR